MCCRWRRQAPKWPCGSPWDKRFAKHFHNFSFLTKTAGHENRVRLFLRGVSLPPCIFPAKGVEYKAQANTGELVRGLRGSTRTSTLLPDADNAAVGSQHVRDFLQEAPPGPPVFFFVAFFLKEEDPAAPDVKGAASAGGPQRAEGERPEPGKPSAMGSRVPA